MKINRVRPISDYANDRYYGHSISKRARRPVYNGLYRFHVYPISCAGEKFGFHLIDRGYNNHGKKEIVMMLREGILDRAETIIPLSKRVNFKEV